MNSAAPSAQSILDQAIKLGLESGWENFTLLALAKASQCTLVDIQHHFRSKDDLAEALFDRADQAMLKQANDPEFIRQTNDQRTVSCIMCWFDFLAPYKAIVKDIMLYKFEPGHFHLQAHGITRVSRTVQWFREVSERPHQGASKVIDEVALTSCYLSCFAFFITDTSTHHSRTRSLLTRSIKNINNAHGCITKNANYVSQLKSIANKFKSLK